MTLTKKEQECFNWLKNGGMMLDVNDRSVYVANMTCLKKDRYGRWSMSNYVYPKRVIKKLISAGMVSEVKKGIYKAAEQGAALGCNHKKAIAT